MSAPTLAPAAPTAPASAEERIARAVAHSGAAALTDILPVVFAVGPLPGADLADPLSLLAPVARVTPSVHPLFDALLDIAGASKMGNRTYAFAIGKKAKADGLVMVLNALPAGIVRHHSRTWDMPEAAFTADYEHGKLEQLNYELPDHWDEDETLWDAIDRHDTSHPRGAASRFAVTLEVTDKRLLLRVLTRGVIYDPTVAPSCKVEFVGSLATPGSLDVALFAPSGRREPLRLLPSQAVAVAEWLAAAGYPVGDLGTPGSLNTMRDRVRRSVVAAPTPGAPGLAELVAGADLDVAATGAPRKGSAIARATVGAGVAVSTIDGVLALMAAAPEEGIAAALDPRVADVGRMALAEPIEHALLRPYQKQAVAVQCATQVGLLNALAPGLGKTVVTLTGMRLEAEKTIADGHAYRALVAVPAAIRMQWSHEVEAWFPEATVKCVRSAADAESLADVLAAAGTTTPVVVIASYQMLAGVADIAEKAGDAGFASARAFLDARDEALPEGVTVKVNLAEVLSRTAWNHLVCDEAALVLRNPGAKRYQALWEIRGNSKVALALTGTPVDKSLDDLGRLLAWVRSDADLFHGKRLAERFDVLDGDALAEYAKAIGPLVFRRDRSEIADELPDIVTEVVLLEGRPEELELANAARTELRRIYVDLMEKMEAAAELNPENPALREAREELAAARGAILGGVTLARMAASDPAAVATSESAGALLLKSKGLVAKATKNPGTKRAQVVDLVVDLVERGEQVLIFTDFSTVAENLVADFHARGQKVGAILGGQNDKVRDAMVTGYQSGEVKILVATSAAREGMNLQATTTLVHYDLPWSPSAVVQRQARANRLGAKGDSLHVLIPIMAGTIEERVSSLLVARAATAMSALDGVRGVSAKGTEMGLALGGLVESANEAELRDGENSLLDMARAVLA